MSAQLGNAQLGDLQLGVVSAGPLAISTTSLPDATDSVAYSQFLAGTGGTPPYTWSVISGSLPAWASLNATTGEISGVPSGTGVASFTVQLDDSVTSTPATQALSITTNAASGFLAAWAFGSNQIV